MIRFYGFAVALLLALVQGNSEVKAQIAPDAPKNVEYFGSLPNTLTQAQEQAFLNRVKSLESNHLIVPSFNPVPANNTDVFKQRDNTVNRYGVYRLTYGPIKFYAVTLFNGSNNVVRYGLPKARPCFNIDRQEADGPTYFFDKYGTFRFKYTKEISSAKNANLAFTSDGLNFNLYGTDDISPDNQIDQTTGEYTLLAPQNWIKSIPLSNFPL
jgi:hypothetical protein